MTLLHYKVDKPKRPRTKNITPEQKEIIANYMHNITELQSTGASDQDVCDMLNQKPEVQNLGLEFTINQIRRQTPRPSQEPTRYIHSSLEPVEQTILPPSGASSSGPRERARVRYPGRTGFGGADSSGPLEPITQRAPSGHADSHVLGFDNAVNSKILAPNADAPKTDLSSDFEDIGKHQRAWDSLPLETNAEDLVHSEIDALGELGFCDPSTILTTNIANIQASGSTIVSINHKAEALIGSINEFGAISNRDASNLTGSTLPVYEYLKEVREFLLDIDDDSGKKSSSKNLSREREMLKKSTKAIYKSSTDSMKSSTLNQENRVPESIRKDLVSIHTPTQFNLTESDIMLQFRESDITVKAGAYERKQMIIKQSGQPNNTELAVNISWVRRVESKPSIRFDIAVYRRINVNLDTAPGHQLNNFPSQEIPNEDDILSASLRGDIEQIEEKLASKEWSIYTCSPSGRTPLWYALSGKFRQKSGVIRRLIDMGAADGSHEDDSGMLANFALLVRLWKTSVESDEDVRERTKVMRLLSNAKFDFTEDIVFCLYYLSIEEVDFLTPEEMIRYLETLPQEKPKEERDATISAQLLLCPIHRLMEEFWELFQINNRAYKESVPIWDPDIALDTRIYLPLDDAIWPERYPLDEIKKRLERFATRTEELPRKLSPLPWKGLDYKFDPDLLMKHLEEILRSQATPLANIEAANRMRYCTLKCILNILDTSIRLEPRANFSSQTYLQNRQSPAQQYSLVLSIPRAKVIEWIHTLTWQAMSWGSDHIWFEALRDCQMAYEREEVIKIGAQHWQWELNKYTQALEGIKNNYINAEKSLDMPVD